MEELKTIQEEIKQLNEKLMQSKKILRRNPNDTDAETEVELYESQLTKLEEQRKEWFELVKEERKNSNSIITHKNKLNPLSNINNNFLLSGKISQAKKTKGVRATLYRLASTCLGYHDGENDAFWYEGDDLMLHVLFESKQNADYFHRRLNDESLYHNTAINLLNIIDISFVCTNNVVGKQIFATDYNPDDYGSPQDAVSLVSGATSILDSSRPLFKFQRIESDSVFGQHYKAENCHLIDKAYYAGNPQEEDDVENNRLALTSDVHNWFDGRNVDVPLFKLTIPEDHLISRKPVLENRYEVPLLVTAIDNDAARLLFPRLREGCTFYQDRKLEAIVTVYVLDPKVFATCIAWKAAKIQKMWDYYNNMEPLV
jgi:hypothetical protein